MTERSAQSFGDEARDTIVKSSLTGVAATMLAVTIFSPAGFGGMIGVSSAFGGGADATSNSDDPYAVLPAYPAPLSGAELDAIQAELARSAVSLEITRAATDERIESLRSLAMDDGLVTFAPTYAAAAPTPAPAREQLRLTLSEPASVEAPAPETITAMPISYGGANMDQSVPYRDPHLELAELFLAHESY
ncbi:hypothetical protein [Vitreimonas sp.]|uniref:hypothetical protein n=1 Tax=Vitreimonas sp. TaxID=3069702 RepID=UPI002EDB75BF